MKIYLTILGCGSSLGVPRADGYWGKCNKKNKKNYRSRCSLAVSRGKNVILIDTSPDLRSQLLVNKIKNISSVLYTHQHADQTHGINDLRVFYFKNKKKIDIYANYQTLKYLKKSFTYCFKKKLGYNPIVKANLLTPYFSLGERNEKIFFEPLVVSHGLINSVGYIFNKTAYISDCKDLSKSNIKKLKDLKLFIIDCLRLNPHPSHLNLDQVLELIDTVKPKKAILTNLHSDLDYNFLLKNTPANVKPAYDGMRISI